MSSDGDGLQPGAVFVWNTDDALAYAAVAVLVGGLVAALCRH
jgi:hypothetical protein